MLLAASREDWTHWVGSLTIVGLAAGVETVVLKTGLEILYDLLKEAALAVSVPLGSKELGVDDCTDTVC